MNNSLRETYNSFADTYDVNRGAFDISDILNSFYSNLASKSGKLLDLGCGAGEPVASYFIDNDWQVTGVDFSERMLELASKYAPKMKAVRSDISDVKFKSNEFDAVTATYSLFHIPSELHVDLFSEIFKWLKPKGKLLFTYATKEATGVEEFSGYIKFMDTEFYYSHKKPAELFCDLQRIGFTIEAQEYHTICNETLLWITAQKPDNK
ncbi:MULTISPECIES: bifunctional 2-polyprenyl-6-hydroxyphenol methylase/3-demethylubiquinol 3-O-methyltransferase UbiG [unclassified Moritella]|uniref:class I SAM-dependent methyltransferase n=1 Tax=unclassified Moritella TaxID=2637987 RepID=UPI001BAB50E4|nr:MULTISPECIES: class I SAM-dependent methyltransferase [unclassified Moritella]QUM80800.1 class I SAM-dependent methyltransferase [Moritella sp. 5]QUM85088.1 class I SAM-dependent methyltransferase [Moritella sp. 28]QUM89322.1 class I SAM-dependent methyltransferase [Moritella sp. 36]